MNTIPPGSLRRAKPPKQLDQVKRCIRDKRYSVRAEEAYVYRSRWYIRFRGLQHPMDMGAVEVKAFLSYLTGMLAKGPAVAVLRALHSPPITSAQTENRTVPDH